MLIPLNKGLSYRVLWYPVELCIFPKRKGVLICGNF